MLELRDVSKVYAPGTVNENCLFRHFSLTIPDGQFVSVVGSNGSGKTSMLNLLCGSIPVDGIVVVTSPQDLVSLIVTKAVRMANMMSKPILGVVENYSYFQCPNCGEKHYIFGQSNLEQVAAEENVKILARVPMDPAMAAAMDQGSMETLTPNYMEPVADAILAHEETK